MAFPEDVLTEDEHVVLHLHPHWKALLGRSWCWSSASRRWWRAGSCCPTATAARSCSTSWPALFLIAALLARVRGRSWSWRTTHYLFTNERVLLQEGVFSRHRRDLPLARVNDHSMNQRFIERLLGCGTLTIESAGERGQSVLTDVPRVDRVQTTLYELVEAQHDKHTLGDGEMRDILADMRDGKPLRDTTG